MDGLSSSGPDATSLLLNTYAVSRGHYDLSQAATTFRYVVELMEIEPILSI
jgi:hypothetical protein